MDSETVFFPLLLTTKTCAVSLLLFLFLAVPLSYWLAGRKGIFTKAVELLITLPLVFPRLRSAICACGFGKKRLDRGPFRKLRP